MVAPPNPRQTPLQQAAQNTSISGEAPQRSSPGDGPRWSGDSENTRPTGLTENPAAGAAGLGAAGAARGAGPGSVLGVLSSTPPARGPEVADDYSPHVAGGAPLSGRQPQRAVAAARSLGEARGQQQYPSGATRRGGESKRAASASAQEVETEMWKLGLQIGSKLDVKDTVDKWCEATVIAVDREAAKVYVTYTYWAPKWNEWISIDSPCLAPAGTMTYQEGGPLRIGHRVEVLDEADQWLEADVVEEGEDGRGRVHFRGFSQKFDAWVSPRGGRVRQFGPYRVAAKGGKANRSSARQASLAPGQQHVRQIAQLSSRYEHYGRALRNKGLRVVPVEGDGNCLFRSVSHQVYGDDSHHRLVRARCMDYMESEAHFFEPYVEGDMAAFLRYLDVKRQNAVWGDDPEVQALCEIYDRPAEIWAYDPQLGAKTLRTFHEAAGSAGGPQRGPPRTPMRLSYYGGGHYDSVAPITDSPAPSGVVLPPVVEAAGATGAGAGGAAAASDPSASEAATDDAAGAVLPIPEPGQLEEAALERSRRRAAEAGSGRWDPEEMKMRKDDEDSPAGRAVMDHALAWSRNVFEAQFDDLDSALVASVDHMEQSNLSSLEAASRDSELVVLQEEMLRTAQAQSEEEQLRNALEASRNTAAAAAAEADLVRQAIAESMGGGAAAAAAAASSDSSATSEGVRAAGAGSPAAAAGDSAAVTPSATVASAGQEQQQQDVGDRAAAAAATAVAAAPGAMEAGDEDEELKKVLLLSGMAAGGAWETLPAEDDDAELRLAIEASLAGD